MAQLQRADVSADRPSIGRFNPAGIGVHDTVAVGDHIVKMSDRRVAQTIEMKRRWPRKTALDNHAVPIAGCSVTNCAMNIEALASPCEQLRRQCYRQFADVHSTYQSGRKRAVFKG